MQDEVNTKVVAIMIKGGKISAEVLKKALDKFVQEIEKAQKQMQQPKTYRGKQSIKHLMSQNAAISNIEVTDGNIKSFASATAVSRCSPLCARFLATVLLSSGSVPRRGCNFLKIPFSGKRSCS